MISVFQSCSVLAQTSRVYNKPNASKIYTSDIDNFYKAFDLALNDTDNAKKIFKFCGLCCQRLKNTLILLKKIH